MAKASPRWRLAKDPHRLFFIAVIVLLVVYASKVNWEEVWSVIRDYNRLALLSAIGLVIVSYLLYGCYDLLGRYYCGHKLAKRQVMLVSFICYAFNLTLSTGGRHWHALSTLFPPRITGQHDHAHFLTQHYHQLAGLYTARRVYFYLRRRSTARALVYRRGHTAHSGYRTAADYCHLSVVLRLR